MSESQIIKCPICQSGNISIHVKEKSFTTKRTRCRAGRSTRTVVSHGGIDVLFDCPSCHATKKDIEAKLKGGKSIPASEAAKRAQAAGLPLKI